MNIELFDNPKFFGSYLQVGRYKNFPIYTGNRPSKDWIAMATDGGKGICINSEAYRILKQSDKFNLYLENICEHEITNGVIHEHYGERPKLDNEIIKYFRDKGIL